MYHPAQSVPPRLVSPRPEKCWAGVQVKREPPISTDCHQSNSITRSAPQPFTIEATSSGTMKK